MLYKAIPHHTKLISPISNNVGCIKDGIVFPRLNVLKFKRKEKGRYQKKRVRKRRKMKDELLPLKRESKFDD